MEQGAFFILKRTFKTKNMGYAGQGLTSVNNNQSLRTSTKRKSKLNGINSPAFHRGIELSEDTRKRMRLANQKRIRKNIRVIMLFTITCVILWIVLV